MTRIHSTSEEVAPMTWRHAYVVEDVRGPGEVNFRMGRCWRPDNRFPGDWALRRHACGGVELTFSGLRHDSRDVVKVIAPEDVDKLILSLLEVRRSFNDAA